MEAKLDEPKYKNWIKCTLALVETKESIHDYVEETFKTLFMELVSDFLPRIQDHAHTNCQYEYKYNKTAKVWNILTNCDVNKLLFEKILGLHEDHKSERIAWKNSDLKHYLYNYWDLVKLFMPKGNSKSTGPNDTDAAAMLNVLNTCTLFHPTNTNLIDKVIASRNKLMHSPNNMIPKEEMENIFVHLMEFLEFDNYGNSGKTSLKEKPACQKAADDIKQLKEAEIDITFKIEHRVLNAKKMSLDHDIAAGNETHDTKMADLVDFRHKVEEELEFGLGMNELQNIDTLQQEKEKLSRDIELLNASVNQLENSTRREKQHIMTYRSKEKSELSEGQRGILQRDIMYLRRVKQQLKLKTKSLEVETVKLQGTKEDLEECLKNNTAFKRVDDKQMENNHGVIQSDDDPYDSESDSEHERDDDTGNKNSDKADDINPENILNNVLWKDIIRECKTDGYTPENILLIGGPNSGKSALIDTIIQVITGKRISKNICGTGSKTSTLKRFKNCAVKPKDVKGKNNEQQLLEVIPKLPNVFVMPCFSPDIAKYDLKLILTLIIRGLVQPGITLSALQQNYSHNTFGTISDFANPELMITKVMFVQACNEPVLEHLMQCTLDVVKQINEPDGPHPYVVTVIPVITKYDRVSRNELADNLESIGEVNGAAACAKNTVLEVEKRVLTKIKAFGPIPPGCLRWFSWFDRIHLDNHDIGISALKCLYQMVQPSKEKHAYIKGGNFNWFTRK